MFSFLELGTFILHCPEVVRSTFFFCLIWSLSSLSSPLFLSYFYLFLFIVCIALLVGYDFENVLPCFFHFFSRVISTECWLINVTLMSVCYELIMQLSLKTEREKKREMYFPKRKYAIKV